MLEDNLQTVWLVSLNDHSVILKNFMCFYWRI